MNKATREDLAARARERAAGHPADVERSVTTGTRQFRLRLWRLYAIAAVATFAVAAILVVAHPASGILRTAATLESITLDPAVASVKVDQSLDISATLHYSDGTTQEGLGVVWTSGKESVATVDGTGRVTAMTPGAVTITASKDGVSATAAVVVVSSVEPAVVTGIRIRPETLTIRVRHRDRFTVQRVYSDRRTEPLAEGITWTSSDTKAVQVTDDGEVVAVSYETSAVITAEWNGHTDTAEVSVPARLKGISVTPAAPTIARGETIQLHAEGFDVHGNAQVLDGVVWRSDPADIASVDRNGLVTAREDGTPAPKGSEVRITATVDDAEGFTTVTVE